jgi:hypothetical protein
LDQGRRRKFPGSRILSADERHPEERRDRDAEEQPNRDAKE